MNCYRIHQKSLNFIYPFKFYSNFTNKNVSWLHFSWPTRYIHMYIEVYSQRSSIKISTLKDSRQNRITRTLLFKGLCLWLSTENANQVGQDTDGQNLRAGRLSQLSKHLVCVGRKRDEGSDQRRLHLSCLAAVIRRLRRRIQVRPVGLLIRSFSLLRPEASSRLRCTGLSLSLSLSL